MEVHSLVRLLFHSFFVHRWRFPFPLRAFTFLCLVPDGDWLTSIHFNGTHFV